MHKKSMISRFLLTLILLAQLQFLTLLDLPVIRIPGTAFRFNPHHLSLLNPAQIDSAGLSSASATLSNPRLSFLGGTSAQVLAGKTVITLATTATTYGDINTNNLFPNDTVAIGVNGNTPVASISSSLIFTLDNALPVTVAAATSIYATQSGTLTLNFYTSSAIPVGGSILIQVPASNGSRSGNPNDGAPDTTTALTTNGFDLNGMTNANVTCPPGPFSAGTLTAGAGGPTAPHTISCNQTAGVSVPAGANLTIVVGAGTKPLVNPAPVNTGHTQGVSDTYNIVIATKDAANGTGNSIESIDARIAPVEGVLVSAIVDETLSFTVAGINTTSGDYCGITRTASSVISTATAVPWGAINSSYTSNKNNAVQQLTVTTNAQTGYDVYAEENDQMGKDGGVCTGATPSAEPYTYTGGGICIRDYNKGGATQIVSTDWTAAPGTDYGLGYSLENVAGGGTDALFLYNESARAFSAKHFADQETGQTKYDANARIMKNTGPVSGSSVYVCYRIHIGGTQPAGYYFNKIKYTAVAKF